MRSVSITYKPSRHNYSPELGSSSKQQEPPQPRLTDRDHLRDRLLSLRSDIGSRTRTRTTQPSRKSETAHPHGVLSSLSIAAAPLHGPLVASQTQRRELSLFSKATVARKLSWVRPPLLGLRAGQGQGGADTEPEDGQWPSCKLKCLVRGRPAEPCSTVLVVSASFAVEEHAFWADMPIEQGIVRHWKILQEHSALLWVCQKEETAKKLLRFSREQGLRIDGLYLVLPSKHPARPLGLNFTPIETDFGIRTTRNSSPLLTAPERSLVVVQGLLVEHDQPLTPAAFTASIPILRSSRAVVHFARLTSEPARLGTVVQLLSQSWVPRPLAVLPFLRAQLEGNEGGDCRCDLGGLEGAETDLLGEAEAMRDRLISYFQRSLSVRMGGPVEQRSELPSVQFLIGDAIRRNYGILQDCHLYEQDYRLHQHHMQLHSRREVGRRRNRPQLFPTLCYLWQL